MPTANCFCHRVDADEAPRGYDLFLQDLGDRYWVSISSVAAAEILEESTHLREATDDDRASLRPPRIAARRLSMAPFPMCRISPCSWTPTIPIRSGRNSARGA